MKKTHCAIKRILGLLLVGSILLSSAPTGFAENTSFPSLITDSYDGFEILEWVESTDNETATHCARITGSYQDLSYSAVFSQYFDVDEAKLLEMYPNAELSSREANGKLLPSVLIPLNEETAIYQEWDVTIEIPLILKEEYRGKIGAYSVFFGSLYANISLRTPSHKWECFLSPIYLNIEEQETPSLPKAGCAAKIQLEGDIETPPRFSLKLEALTAGAPLPERTDASIDGPGDLLFEDITFPQAGEWRYRVSQLDSNNVSILYDQSVYDWVVTVAEGDDGVLQIQEKYYDLDGMPADPVFVNRIKQEKLQLSMREDSVAAPTPGMKWAYTVVVENAGELPTKPILVRAYAPQYTVYLSSSKGGIYGVIDGQEHATWYLGSILPGERRECTLYLQAHYCLPDRCSLHAQAVYVVYDEATPPHVNAVISDAVSIP